MLEGFRVAEYHFTLRVLERMELPKFKGALLRGVLGYSLKRVCWHGSNTDMHCRQCVLHAPCPYAYLFETCTSKRLGAQPADMPRPYVLEPPLDGKTDYAPGDRLAFGLTLVGKAIDYLPYFFAAYASQGAFGLGKDWGRYELERVEAIEPATRQAKALFDDGHWIPSEDTWSVDFSQLAELAGQLSATQVTLSLVTPLRLTLSQRTRSSAKEYVDGLAAEPAFPVLLDNLLKRVALLYRVHCGRVWTDSREALHEAAVGVRSECDTHWVPWGRTSTRQGRDLDYGGLLGRARYSGDLRPFLPFLLLGSLIHVGEKCDAGNGLYRLVWPRATRGGGGEREGRQYGAIPAGGRG